MSLWDDSLDLGIRSRDAIQEFAYVNSDLVYATGVIVVVVGVLLLIANRQPKVKNPGEGQKVLTRQEEYLLTLEEKKQYENNLIADGIADVLLRLSVDGKLSAERYQHWHLRFGTCLGLKDLLPAQMTPLQLKKAIKTRRGHPEIYRPVPFPKETPTTPTTLKGILSKFKS